LSILKIPHVLFCPIDYKLIAKITLKTTLPEYRYLIQNIFTTYRLQFYNLIFSWQRCGRISRLRCCRADLQNKNFQTLLTHEINNLEASIQHLMLQLFYQSLSRSWVWVRGGRVERIDLSEAI